MDNILDIYESIDDSIEEIDEFRIYDFIYYLGINTVDKDIPKDEIERLINICKKSLDNFIDPFKLARSLTSVVYKDNYLSLEELERIPSESIKYFYSEEKMYEMRYYFESYDEIITPPKKIMNGLSYTIARVVNNGYCVELHYCSDEGARIEYGTKVAHDRWEYRKEDIDWFNKDLSDDYILNRLNCLYDEEFSEINLSDDKVNELNLIDHILSKHKVYDIELYVNANDELFAFDDSNFWKGKEFYDFIFNELFVYNKDGKVELIQDSDYEKLEEYRNQYDEKPNYIDKGYKSIVNEFGYKKFNMIKRYLKEVNSEANFEKYNRDLIEFVELPYNDFARKEKQIREKHGIILLSDVIYKIDERNKYDKWYNETYNKKDKVKDHER